MGWLVPILLACAIVESAAVPGLIKNNLRPELALVVVVGWGSIRGWQEGLLAGVIGGFFGDLTSAAPFGVNIVRLGALGLVAGLVMDRLARTSAVFPVAAAVAGSLCGFMLSVLGLQAGGWVASWERSLIFDALPRALIAGACMVIAFPALRALEQRALRAEGLGPSGEA